MTTSLNSKGVNSFPNIVDCMEHNLHIAFFFLCMWISSEQCNGKKWDLEMPHLDQLLGSPSFTQETHHRFPARFNNLLSLTSFARKTKCEMYKNGGGACKPMPNPHTAQAACRLPQTIKAPASFCYRQNLRILLWPVRSKLSAKCRYYLRPDRCWPRTRLRLVSRLASFERAC